MTEWLCPKCEGTGVSAMRRAILAPPGHVIVVCDLSQIEARMLAWLSGQDDLLEEFRRGDDVYSNMASLIFSEQVTKKDKDKRFIGKTTILGCGYGLGWRTYQGRLRVGILGDKGRILDYTVAQALGISVEVFLSKPSFSMYVEESCPSNLDFTTHATHCACCEAIIRLFRSNKPMIPMFWDTCSEMIARMYEGSQVSFGRNGILQTDKESIILPNGTRIRYPELTATQKKRSIEYSYLKNRKKKEHVKLYGGAITENVDQALSRIVITDAMLRMNREGIIPRHQVHDEILAVCPANEGADIYRRMREIMTTPPSWCPEIPLAAEGGFDRRYIK